MSHSLKTGLAAAVGAALLCLPAVSAHAASDLFSAGGTTGAGALAVFASTASTSVTPLLATTQSVTQTQIASDFLTQTINQSNTSTGATGSSGSAAQESVFVQSGPARRNPLSVNLRGESDLALWNLVASVRAQQTGNSFDLIDTGLASLQLATGPVSPVPLPGAAWLFVMGVLGLTGTRLTGISPAAAGAKKDDDRRSAMGPSGSAVPA